MKLRSHFFSVVALFCLSLVASAQARSPVPRQKTANSQVRYGSYERTKLLTQMQRSCKQDVLRLGSVDRRALLSTGKSIHKPKPKHRYRR